MYITLLHNLERKKSRYQLDLFFQFWMMWLYTENKIQYKLRLLWYDLRKITHVNLFYHNIIVKGFKFQYPKMGYELKLANNWFNNLLAKNIKQQHHLQKFHRYNQLDIVIESKAIWTTNRGGEGD